MEDIEKAFLASVFTAKITDKRESGERKTFFWMRRIYSETAYGHKSTGSNECTHEC